MLDVLSHGKDAKLNQPVAQTGKPHVVAGDDEDIREVCPWHGIVVANAQMPVRHAIVAALWSATKGKSGGRRACTRLRGAVLDTMFSLKSQYRDSYLS